MAYIEKRRNKKWTTYRITVYCGDRDAQGRHVKHRTTYKPEPGMTEYQADKKAKAIAEEFEKRLRYGLHVDDSVTVSEWIRRVLSAKEIAGRKKKTISGYRRCAVRVEQAFGNIPLKDVRTIELNTFFQKLKEETRAISERAVARPKIDWTMLLRTELLSKTELGRRAGISESTIANAIKGEKILAAKANRIAEALCCPADELFVFLPQTQCLSNRTVESYYHFLSLIFAAAEREGILAVNPMKHIERLTFERTEAVVLQPDEIQKILQAAENEPIDKKCLLHLFLITGCRRGEIAGLRWSRILWKEQAIRIDNTIQYTPENGVYQESTKTRQNRIIRLPYETMELLQEYRLWKQRQCSEEKGGKMSDYLFTRRDGELISPETISGYIRRFKKKYEITQISPHLFRHTMASILYYSGSDPVSISKRLGHAQVSTTQNIYSHLIQQADIDSAEHIADAIFRGKNKKV